MQRLTGILVIGMMMILGGCAGFGRSTENPAQKIQWADELISSKEDPIPAEKLIREAIDLYQKSNNQLGLAESYREYGIFFRSYAVTRSEKYYKEKGFLDTSANINTRYQKALEYFTKAKDIFKEQNRFEDLSNMHVSIAKTLVMLNLNKAACDELKEGLDTHAAFTKANPEAKELRSEEMTNYVEYIGTLKTQIGCTEQVAQK